MSDYTPDEWARLTPEQRQYTAWRTMARQDAAWSPTKPRGAYSAGVAARNAATHPGQTWAMERAYADEYGVELGKLGTHFTLESITQAANVRPSEPGQKAAKRPEVATAGPRLVEVRQAGSPVVAGEVGLRNPLVAAALRDSPVEAAQAQAHAPEPTLFSAGDLPDFTASGVDPKVLLRVPWNARQALAAEPSSVAVFVAVEKFNGLDATDAEALAQEEGLEGPGVADYQRRVQDWLLAGLTEDQVYGLMGFDEPGGPRYKPLAYDPKKTPKQPEPVHDDSQLGLPRAYAKNGEHIPGGLPRQYPAANASPAPRMYPTPHAQAPRVGPPTAEDAQFKSLSERFGW